MKDRAPRYPGRVKMVPVSGQTNVYDMTRLDQPTQVGDPMNKATFLKDATAALYGLGADAVPDEVLAIIANWHEERVQAAFGSYTGTGTYDETAPNKLTFQFQPRLLILSEADPALSSDLGDHTLVFPYGKTRWNVSSSSAQDDNGIAWGADYVRWWCNMSAKRQFNESGRKYVFYAFG